MSKTFLNLDIETTGLDYDDDYILEIAWNFLDEKYQPIESVSTRSYLVDHDADWVGAWSRLKDAPAVVRNMHKDSGLAGALVVDPLTRWWVIVEQLQRDLRSTFTRPSYDDTIHLLGASAHFDAHFLYSKGLRALFDDKQGIHHRIADLSSVKLFLESRGIAYESYKNVGLAPHRAESDLDENRLQAQEFFRLFGELPV
jgi:oligoribonuclease (3'-5' exoribonuclease)